MRSVAAILALALVAAASATVVVRQAKEASVIGGKPYGLVAQSPNSNCAQNFSHGTVDLSPVVPNFQNFGVVGSINFTQITAVGAQCQGLNESGAMVLLSQDELGRKSQSIANFLKLNDTALRKIIVAGIDTQARRCGDFQASNKAYYAFTQDIDFLKPELIKFNVDIPPLLRRSGEKWMISYIPEQSAICAYIDQTAQSFNEARNNTALTENPPVNNNATVDPTNELLATPSPDAVASPAANFTNTTAPTTNVTTNGSGRICFPGSATVELEDGSVKKMTQVEIGDRVKVAPGVFSDVFMFTHKLEDAVNDFVVVKTSSGAELALTAGHYLYVNGALVAAKTIRAGDVVESAAGDLLTVASVGVKTMVGLYNPQTVQGDIIVNGIRASTYTTAVHPGAAHALLAPLRGLYARLGFATAAFNQGSDFLANQAPAGAAILA